MLAKLRWTKNPCGTRVSKTQVPIDHLLPSFFFSCLFFFSFLHLTSQDSSSSSPSSNIQTHFSKSQTQKSQSRHRSAMGLMISASERLRFVDLGTKGPFSVFFGLVCLLIDFLCFLGWSISDGIFSTMGLCFLG